MCESDAFLRFVKILQQIPFSTESQNFLRDLGESNEMLCSYAPILEMDIDIILWELLDDFRIHLKRNVKCKPCKLYASRRLPSRYDILMQGHIGYIYRQECLFLCEKCYTITKNIYIYSHFAPEFVVIPANCNKNITLYYNRKAYKYEFVGNIVNKCEFIKNIESDFDGDAYGIYTRVNSCIKMISE